MKSFKLTLTMAFTALVVFLMSNTAFSQDSKKSSDAKICEVTYSVPDMECANCQKKVMAKMPYVKGVKDLKTNLTDRTIWIKYDSSKTSKAQLEEALAKVGFPGKETTGKK